MKKYLIPVDKEKFLKENSPFEIDINEERECIHCGEIIKVRDYKVEKCFIDKEQVLLICCPNAPRCDGYIIDWFKLEKNDKEK